MFPNGQDMIFFRSVFGQLWFAEKTPYSRDKQYWADTIFGQCLTVCCKEPAVIGSWTHFLSLQQCYPAACCARVKPWRGLDRSLTLREIAERTRTRVFLTGCSSTADPGADLKHCLSCEAYRGEPVSPFWERVRRCGANYP